MEMNTLVSGASTSLSRTIVRSRCQRDEDAAVGLTEAELLRQRRLAHGGAGADENVTGRAVRDQRFDGRFVGDEDLTRSGIELALDHDRSHVRRRRLVRLDILG